MPGTPDVYCLYNGKAKENSLMLIFLGFGMLQEFS
jgi:hypothetical protein